MLHALTDKPNELAALLATMPSDTLRNNLARVEKLYPRKFFDKWLSRELEELYRTLCTSPKVKFDPKKRETMLDLNRFPEYRKNPDGSDPTFEQRMETRSQQKWAGIRREQAIERQTSNPKNPFAAHLKSLQSQLDSWGDTTDERGRTLLRQLKGHQLAYDKWEANNASTDKLPAFKRSVKQYMDGIEERAAMYSPETLSELRSLASLPPDVHGESERMFFDKALAVETALFQRQKQAFQGGQEGALKSQADSTRAELEQLQTEERLKAVAAKVQAE